MADGQSEQAQNLVEVLGFDPTEDPSRFTPQVSQLKYEPDDFPEDWKKRFPADIRAGIVNGHAGEAFLVVDSDNLFTISESNSERFGNPDRIHRAYHRYHPRKSAYPSVIFEISTTALLQKGEEALMTLGETGDRSEVRFYDRGTPADEGLRLVLNKTLGGRNVNINYDKQGNLVAIFYEIRYTSQDLDEEGIPDVYEDFITLMQVKDGNGWHSTTGHKGGRLELEEDAINNTVTAKRMENDNIIDEFQFPLEVDVDALKKKWLTEELLRDSKSPDVNLDESWRGVDFFHDAGLRWDAVADDSLHTLTRIPEPAPDE